MIDDLFDLRAVERFVLKQRFCDYFQLIAIGDERCLRQLIGVVEQFAYFLIYLLRCRFAVVARAGNVAAEKHIIFVLAVLDHSHFFAHAPFANHPACNCCSGLDVATRAICDVAENDFLGDAAAHAHCETSE